MITYLRNTEIDKQRWDECISSSPQGLVYAFSWYLDEVAPGWEALIEDDYKSVFPLTKRKKYGFHYLFQPYFNQQLGLFSRSDSVPEEKLRAFLSSIPKKFKLVEIQMNHFNKLSYGSDFKFNERITHHLPLTGNYEMIRKDYSENLVRNLKTFRNSKNTISKNIPAANIVELFRENRGTSIVNLKENDYQIFSKLIEKATDRKYLESIGVLNEEGRLIAGALFMKSVHSYIFLFSGTDENGRKSGAMSALIDSFIMEHSVERMYLDFEGSMDQNLSRFYKSFGSKEIVYLQIRKNNLPLIIRWLK